MAGIKKHLFAYSTPNHYLFVGERQHGLNSILSPKMDHLVCFLPAAIALAATDGRSVQSIRDREGSLTKKQSEYLLIAEELTLSCYQMYRQVQSGLAPEIVYWNMDADGDRTLKMGPVNRPLSDSARSFHPQTPLDFTIGARDKHNLLRPETVESLFTMYRITGDKKYREWGWEIFQSFEKWTRVNSGGYSSLDDVTKLPPPMRDKMETFFLVGTVAFRR
jgi:hypothetical protein